MTVLSLYPMTDCRDGDSHSPNLHCMDRRQPASVRTMAMMHWTESKYIKHACARHKAYLPALVLAKSGQDGAHESFNL